jgi:hypothetical protein
MTTEEKENLHTDMMVDDPIIDERLKFDPRVAEDEKPVTLDENALSQIVYRSRLVPPRQVQMPLTLNGLRVNQGTMVSPLSSRPAVNSPSLNNSTTKQLGPFQTPK